MLSDADGDTYVRTEATAGADADTLSLVAGGVEALTVTTDGVRSHGNGLLEGDATPGDVLHTLKIQIEDGTTAATLRVHGAAWSVDYNGDWPDVNNIAKGSTAAYYDLNGGGTALTIHPAASGVTSFVTVLSVDINYNDSGTMLYVVPSISSGNIILSFTDGTGTGVDMTTLVDSGTIAVQVTFLTN